MAQSQILTPDVTASDHVLSKAFTLRFYMPEFDCDINSMMNSSA